MKIKCGFAFLLLSAQCSAATFTQAQLERAVTLSYMAGVCSELSHIADFQLKNKIENGDTFIKKAVSDRAASIGIAGDKLSESCNQTLVEYVALAKSIEKDKAIEKGVSSSASSNEKNKAKK
ncbi:MAG: hypothetical protein V4525_15280 [Pseudomonadota bacterium]